MTITTRITRMLGIRHPIIQAGMSWASSGSTLPIAVSNAGGLGVIAAGPMRLPDLQAAIREVKAATSNPFAVNVPLYRPGSADVLDLLEAERVPVVIASQGGPKPHLARFHAYGCKWLHVVASVAHATKAASAGVDGLVVVGTEAGGHPPPAEVGTLVIVRRIARSIDIPIVAGGGVADGAGIVALLALGADAVQLGTRFLLTPESRLHQAYKDAVLAADVDGTTLVGRGRLPVRIVRNRLSARLEEAEREGLDPSTRAELIERSTLKMAALDGDVDWGKVEAGQSAGLVDSIMPAAEVIDQLVKEIDQTLMRFESLR